MHVYIGRDETANSYVMDAKRTISVGPAKTVTMYDLTFKRDIAPNCLSHLMCAMAAPTKTGALCKNVSTTQALHIMNIKPPFLKQGKASPFLKGTSSIWTG